MSTNLIQIAPALIVASLTNPRKTFDQGKLSELAESIKASGLHQPVLVRPLPASRVADTAGMNPRPTHELVVGERRLRASTMAEQAEIPAIVRDLSDTAALEIQVIENLQRDDLAELEEAEGYEHLMQQCGLNADQVAAKIGKSRSYVYARLKLLDVPQAAKEAMRTGDLDTSKALEIARVPTEKLQLRALEEATRQNHLGETCSVRVFKGWIRNNLMLKLQTAVFDIKDAKLCRDAGSCMQCPKRTGADPDLFADVDSPDLCTDITCFHEKVEAHSAQVVAKAKKRGLEIIDGEEARKEVPYPGAFLNNYAPLDEKIDSDVDGESTLRQHLSKEELKQVKLLIDPFTKQPREVVPEELAEKVHERLTAASAKTAGNKSPSPAAKAKSAQEVARALAQKRSSLEQSYHRTWHRMAYEQIAPRVRAGEINSFDPAMLRAVLFHQIAPFHPPEPDDLVAVMDAGDIDADEVDSTINTLATIDDLSVGQTLVLWLLKTEIDPMFEYDNGACVYLAQAPMIEACAARLGIDLEAIRSEVREDMRAEFAELDPPSDPLPSAAPATEPAAGKPKKGGSKKKAAPAPAPQLSIEEAEQGIAAAMQGGNAAAATAAEEGAADAAQGDEAAADDGRGGQASSDWGTELVPAWPFPKTKGSPVTDAQA